MNCSSKSLSQAPSRDSKQPDQAFTLIELLVVIAILGILSAMLFPALQGARNKAKYSQCANNHRSAGTAILDYATSNQGILPGSTVGATNTWITEVRDNIGEPGQYSTPVYALACPLLKKRNPLGNAGDTHYAMNENLIFRGNTSKLPRLANAKSRSASLMELITPSSTAMVIGDTLNAEYVDEGAFSSGNSAKFPHGGDEETRGSITFADGHVQNMGYDDVPPNNSDIDVKTFWQANPDYP